MLGDEKLSACWEATQPYLCFYIYFSRYLTSFYLIFACNFTLYFYLFAFMFAFVFLQASHSLRRREQQNKEIQPQENSTNEEKNATNANTR